MLGFNQPETCMSAAKGNCCLRQIDGYGNRYQRFREGVCEASVGNLRVSSRHRAPLSEPAGRVPARMTANQRPEIHRKRNLTPNRNVGIYVAGIKTILFEKGANICLTVTRQQYKHFSFDTRLIFVLCFHRRSISIFYLTVD